jgi:hypothetical protein
MTESEERFHKVFEKFGGIFDMSYGLEEDTINFFEKIKEMALSLLKILRPRYPRLPAININFIDNLSLNACATKYQGEYFIGINTGCYLLMLDLYSKIFSSQNVLTYIGDVTLETAEKKTLNAFYSGQGITCNLSLQDNATPKDPVRRFHSRAYAQFAFRFLIHHELAHIIRGHVAYLGSITQNFSWSETEYKEIKELLGFAFSQTFEMDADSFAINHAFLIANLNIQNLDENLEAKKLYKDFKTFYSHWSFSIYCFFKLFGFDEVDVEKAKTFTHPPAAVRMSMVLANVGDILLKNNIKEVDEIGKQMFKSADDAEHAYSEVTFQINNPKFLAKTFRDTFSYMEEIAGNWNNVRPVLEQFAYGDLPPLVKQV